jgi:4-hydroxy-4-methyl-2-oxoglutarate aldolase
VSESDDQSELSLPSMEGLRTADIVDAMGRRHRHRCHILDLVSPTPHRPLSGRAATISFAPSCEARLPVDRFNFSAAFDVAVGDDGRGKVLVLASNGYPDTSLGGGTKLSRLDHRGLAGLLADGRLRDFDQLAQYRFTARCRGETTHWGGGDVTPMEAGRPVVFGGVLIMPDDLIYADASGAVVVPAAEAAAVMSLALEIAGEEASARAGIGDEERLRR